MISPEEWRTDCCEHSPMRFCTFCFFCFFCCRSIRLDAAAVPGALLAPENVPSTPLSP